MVDKYESWMDGTCVKLDEYDNIVAFVPGKSFDFKEKEEYYKTVNIYKFSKHFSQDIYVPFLEAYCSALGENEYYEQVLRVITMLDTPGIKGMRLSGQKWYEIDDEQDLDIATTLFAPDDETRINLMHKDMEDSGDIRDCWISVILLILIIRLKSLRMNCVQALIHF